MLIHSLRMFLSQTLPWHDFTCADSYLRHLGPRKHASQFLLFLGPHLSGAVGEIPVLCHPSPSLRCAKGPWWEPFLSSWVEPHPGHGQLRFLGVSLSEGGRAREGLMRTKEEEAQGIPNPAAPISLLLGQV